jgi:osmotically-inducible protein OsmY
MRFKLNATTEDQMNTRDNEHEQRIQRLLDEARIPVAVVVDDGIARLIGAVPSERLRQAAIDLASADRQIKRVDDEMNEEVVSPDMVSEPLDNDGEFSYVDDETTSDEIPDDEDDFQSDNDLQVDSTLDYEEVVEDRETYFPPTDPVVEPERNSADIEIVGGFQSEATEDTDEDEDEAYAESVPLATGDRLLVRDDEDIRDDVIRELREDALTTDFQLGVDVRRGVVFLTGKLQTLDDAENAQAVAARVAGVIDVEDRIETDEG